ncbi:MAG TPA: hypothetical protein VFX15_10280 [Actinomycetes bacterium]|nr:hypothetical protein [Actinomycetes bacterium]
MSDTVSPEAPTASAAEGSAGSRRMLLLLGGLAVLLVLGAAAYFLFLSGGVEEDSGGLPTGAAPQPTTSAPEDDKNNKGKEDEGKDEPEKIQVGRDPFAPLPAEAVKEEPATQPTETDTSDSTAAGSDTNGATTNTGGSGATPAPLPTTQPVPAPTTEPEEPEVAYKVVLRSVDLAKETATIEVDGKRYVVKVKEMFTNTKTGPFKLTEVGERANGTDTAMVVFGSDAPVELVQKDKVVFSL